MIFRVLAFLVVVSVGYMLFNSYGYRYVLEDVREKAKPEMVMGGINSPTNILAYIDYDSSASRQLHATFLNLLSVNSGVSILLRPVAGNTSISQLTSRLVLAAAEQGRFMDVHNVLMAMTFPLNESYIEQAIKSLGMDYDRLKADSMSSQIESQITKISGELLLLNIDSIPFYYIEHIKMDRSKGGLSNIQAIITKLENRRL